MKKSHPMPFKASMVQAILAGQKTKTREILEIDIEGVPIRSKIKVGDFLWVREAWQAHCDMDHLKPSLIPAGSDIIYNADRPDMPWVSRKRPSIFMSKWASRITLEVTGVKVQRLNDINEVEALAEGVEATKFFIKSITCPSHSRDAFMDLWESINGAGSWDTNPWVVEYTFKVHMKNIGEMK